MPANLESRFPDIARELRPLVDHAVEEAAEAVAARAKVNVPVDEGDLMRAIHVEPSGPAEYRVIAGGGPKDVFYGHIIEQGAVGAGREHSFSLPPRPFLVPALEYERLRIGERIEAALNNIRGVE